MAAVHGARNRSQAASPNRSLSKPLCNTHRLPLSCIAIMLALMATFALSALTPALAHAADASYSIDELSTQVTVETNASVHVIERQILTFSDRNMGVTWHLHTPDSGESVRIENVSAVPVDDGGTALGDWMRLQMIDSDPNQQGRNPGDQAAPALRSIATRPWYSYNIGDGMMRSYFPTSKSAYTQTRAQTQSESHQPTDEENDFHTYLIETDYLVLHRTRVYRDVAELYWRYADESLPADSHEVNLQVTLPLPVESDPVAASENIRAWGHGPEEGTFAVGDDGTVTYHIDEIAQGNYAEAHIILPADWMNNMAPSAANTFSELRGPAAIVEESGWVDTELRAAEWDNKVRVLFLGMALIVLLLGAISVFRNGRSPLSRRALIRVFATLGIIALGANLFFREPLTTIMLTLLALAVLVIALMLPLDEDPTETPILPPG